MSEQNKGRNLLKRYLGPGIWEDMDGAVHFSLPEILAHMGVENTLKNQEQLREVVRVYLLKHSPAAKVIDRHKPDDRFGKG